MRGGNARGVVELGYVREIEQTHVNRAVDHASRVQLAEDRMVLQRFPQDFVVDDHPGHRDPRNMLASRLEINRTPADRFDTGAQYAGWRGESGASCR